MKCFSCGNDMVREGQWQKCTVCKTSIHDDIEHIITYRMDEIGNG